MQPYGCAKFFRDCAKFGILKPKLHKILQFYTFRVVFEFVCPILFVPNFLTNFLVARKKIFLESLLCSTLHHMCSTVQSSTPDVEYCMVLYSICVVLCRKKIQSEVQSSTPDVNYGVVLYTICRVHCSPLHQIQSTVKSSTSDVEYCVVLYTIYIVLCSPLSQMQNTVWYFSPDVKYCVVLYTICSMQCSPLHQMQSTVLSFTEYVECCVVLYTRYSVVYSTLHQIQSELQSYTICRVLCSPLQQVQNAVQLCCNANDDGSSCCLPWILYLPPLMALIKEGKEEGWACLLYSTLYTVCCVLYTVYCILYIVYCMMYTVHCMQTVCRTMYRKQCMLHRIL